MQFESRLAAITNIRYEIRIEKCIKKRAALIITYDGKFGDIKMTNDLMQMSFVEESINRQLEDNAVQWYWCVLRKSDNIFL